MAFASAGEMAMACTAFSKRSDCSSLIMPLRSRQLVAQNTSWQHNRIGCQSDRLLSCGRASTNLATVSFGGEIRRRRQALGWTLEQLAERSKLSPNYVGTIESGRRDPSLSTVLALAKGLRVPAGELLGPVKDLTPAAYDVGRTYDGSPEDVQDLVVRLLHVTTRRRR